MKSASWAVVKTSGRPPAWGQSRPSGTGMAARSCTTASSAWPPPPTTAITRSPSEKRRAPGPRARDLAGELEARDVCGLAGRRGIGAAALQHVRAVQPGAAHAHQDLAVPGLGIGVLLDDELSVPDGHRPHGAGNLAAAGRF